VATEFAVVGVSDYFQSSVFRYKELELEVTGGIVSFSPYVVSADSQTFQLSGVDGLLFIGGFGDRGVWVLF
jgi:hypothetical protein